MLIVVEAGVRSKFSIGTAWETRTARGVTVHGVGRMAERFITAVRVTAISIQKVIPQDPNRGNGRGAVVITLAKMNVGASTEIFDLPRR